MQPQFNFQNGTKNTDSLMALNLVMDVPKRNIF